MKSSRTVILPENICLAAEKKFAHRFGSFEDFLVAILDHILRDDAIRIDEKEEKIIEERLKGLGYL